ncbi:unnamed protein product [Pleuronectes platessa]|uniref:Uncharacterized protein n=1 Tax=Pleuronectes platessa TaxID=8262 RepID=A0A9N7U8J8_PLEPL|nr:unnamed protein product [Pleuronectes platessa]
MWGGGSVSSGETELHSSYHMDYVPRVRISGTQLGDSTPGLRAFNQDNTSASPQRLPLDEPMTHFLTRWRLRMREGGEGSSVNTPVVVLRSDPSLSTMDSSPPRRPEQHLRPTHM